MTPILCVHQISGCGHHPTTTTSTTSITTMDKLLSFWWGMNWMRWEPDPYSCEEPCGDPPPPTLLWWRRVGGEVWARQSEWGLNTGSQCPVIILAQDCYDRQGTLNHSKVHFSTGATLGDSGIHNPSHLWWWKGRKLVRQPAWSCGMGTHHTIWRRKNMYISLVPPSHNTLQVT